MAALKKFIIKGEISIPGGARSFVKNAEGLSKNHALNTTISCLGSDYGIRKQRIEVFSVEEVK